MSGAKDHLIVSFKVPLPRKAGSKIGTFNCSSKDGCRPPSTTRAPEGNTVARGMSQYRETRRNRAGEARMLSRWNIEKTFLCRLYSRSITLTERTEAIITRHMCCAKATERQAQSAPRKARPKMKEMGAIQVCGTSVSIPSRRPSRYWKNSKCPVAHKTAGSQSVDWTSSCYEDIPRRNKETTVPGRCQCDLAS